MSDPIDGHRTLGEIAHEVRSKNAGPFWVTFEVFMPDEEQYRLAEELVTAEVISQLYRVPAEDVQIFALPNLHVVKVSFPRQVSQGSLRDHDMHSGQQHVVLASLPLPLTVVQ